MSFTVDYSTTVRVLDCCDSLGTLRFTYDWKLSQQAYFIESTPLDENWRKIEDTPRNRQRIEDALNAAVEFLTRKRGWKVEVVRPEHSIPMSDEAFAKLIERKHQEVADRLGLPPGNYQIIFEPSQGRENRIRSLGKRILATIKRLFKGWKT